MPRRSAFALVAIWMMQGCVESHPATAPAPRTQLCVSFDPPKDDVVEHLGAVDTVRIVSRLEGRVAARRGDTITIALNSVTVVNADTVQHFHRGELAMLVPDKATMLTARHTDWFETVLAVVGSTVLLVVILLYTGIGYTEAT